MNYSGLNSKNLAPWLWEYAHSMMLLDQLGFNVMHLRKRSIPQTELFDPKAIEERLEPFRLKQVALAFVILGIGVIAAAISLFGETVNYIRYM